jgi:hypothetical protein
VESIAVMFLSLRINDGWKLVQTRNDHVEFVRCAEEEGIEEFKQRHSA